MTDIDNTRPHGRNTEVFNQIADQIENDPKSHFQRNWWVTQAESECGTAGCIAGWAVHFTEKTPVVLNPRIAAVARIHLGISHDDADILFDPHWQPAEGLTPAEALRKIGGGDDVKDCTTQPLFP